MQELLKVICLLSENFCMNFSLIPNVSVHKPSSPISIPPSPFYFPLFVNPQVKTNSELTLVLQD